MPDTWPPWRTLRLLARPPRVLHWHGTHAPGSAWRVPPQPGDPRTLDRSLRWTRCPADRRLESDLIWRRRIRVIDWAMPNSGSARDLVRHLTIPHIDPLRTGDARPRAVLATPRSASRREELATPETAPVRRDGRYQPNATMVPWRCQRQRRISHLRHTPRVAPPSVSRSSHQASRAAVTPPHPLGGASRAPPFMEVRASRACGGASTLTRACPAPGIAVYQHRGTAVNEAPRGGGEAEIAAREREIAVVLQ